MKKKNETIFCNLPLLFLVVDLDSKNTIIFHWNSCHYCKLPLTFLGRFILSMMNFWQILLHIFTWSLSYGWTSDMTRRKNDNGRVEAHYDVFQIDIYVFTCLITAYVKKHKYKTIEYLFNEIQHHGYSPIIITYNSILNVYGKWVCLDLIFLSCWLQNQIKFLTMLYKKGQKLHRWKIKGVKIASKSHLITL